MKKNEKIMIGILVLILVIMIGSFIFNKVKTRQQNIWIDKDNPVSSNEGNQKKIGRIVKVKGTLYYDTGKKSTELRCGMMDGEITSTVAEGEIPTKENQANFEGAKGYQYGRENTIEVPIDEEWCIFAPKSFCGTIKKVEYNNCLFVEPDEGEEIRKSADLIQISMLRLDTNVKFEIGERIKISYTGEVLETYPAQIYAISYEHLINYDEYDEITTLHSETASTEILIRFNGTLYGKSFSVIDYAGGNEKIGTIDKLIDSKYVPKFSGETNNEAILGASVFEASDKTIVLNYNNVYVLFEKI